MSSGRRDAFRPGTLTYLRQAAAAKAMVPLDLLLGTRLEAAFGIVTYHRVSPRPAKGPLPPLNVTPARLQRQLDGLLRRGFEPWRLSDALDCHEQGRPIPRRAFVVVFDDGFQGVHRHALPILSGLRVPATVFMPTAFLDSDAPLPFDDWDSAGDPAVAAEAWRALSTPECRELLDSGWFEIGSHTHTHRDLRGRPDELRADVARSVRELRERFAIEAPTFSFPFGARDAATTEAVRAAGVRCALTTDCQLVTPADDPFGWGRFGAEEYDTAATLAAKLNGQYSCAQNAWRRMKRLAGR